LLVLGSAATRLAEAERVALECIGQVQIQLWEPATCPICESGLPLEGDAATVR
jgi:hypothetical protein